MSAVRDPDTIIFAWLDDGPTDLPPETRNAIVIGAGVVHQRPPTWLSWRSHRMTTPFRLGAMAAALGAVVVVALIAFKPGLSPDVGTVPSSSTIPSPSAIPSPTEIPPVADWVAFTSPFYGFTVRHPAGWTVIPATEHWGLPEVVDLYPQFDKIDSGDWSFTGLGMRLRDGETSEEWLQAYFGATIENGDIESGDECTPGRSEWEAVEIDGQPAFIVRRCGPALDTVVFAGGRVYVFTAWGGLVDDRPLFDSFLSTISLEPASAVDPTP
jgi:hypothetical protein